MKLINGELERKRINKWQMTNEELVFGLYLHFDGYSDRELCIGVYENE